MANGNDFNTFPGGFARQILGLSEIAKQRNAELAELRRARAARNFLDKEKVSLRQEAAGVPPNATGRGAGGGQNLNPAQAAQFMRLQLEAERLRASDADKLQSALLHYESEGQAVLPWHAAGFARKLKSSGEEVDITPVPGVGVVVQRVSGPQGETLRKMRLEREKIEAEIALKRAETQSAAALRDQRLANADKIANEMRDGDFGRVSELLRARQTMLSTSSEFANSLESQADGLILQNRVDEAQQLLDRAAEIRRRPEMIFEDRPKWKKLLDTLDDTLAASIKAANRSATREGAPLNRSDRPTLDQSTNGLFSSGSTSAVNLADRMAQDPDLPTIPGWRTLHPNFAYRPSGGGPERRFHADKHTGRLVPLNEPAFQDALRPNFKGRLHPLWRRVGWTPQNAQPSAAPARPQSQEPQAPPTGPAVAPLPPSELDQRIADLEARFRAARAQGDTAAIRAIQQEANALRTQSSSAQ